MTGFSQASCASTAQPIGTGPGDLASPVGTPSVTDFRRVGKPGEVHRDSRGQEQNPDDEHLHPQQ